MQEVNEIVKFRSLEDWQKSFQLLKCLEKFPDLRKFRLTISLKSSQVEKLRKQKLGIELKKDENSEIQKKCVLFYGNITHLDSDLMVNSANSVLSSGSGVNGSVWRLGGEKLKSRLTNIFEKERKEEPLTPTECVITNGYNCPCKRIIHIVCPNCKSGVTDEKKDQLRKCYEKCLKILSEEKECKSISICCMSTGKFEFPLIESCHIALSIVRKWLEIDENRKSVEKIIFCVKSKELHAIYEHLMQLYFPE